MFLVKLFNIFNFKHLRTVWDHYQNTDLHQRFFTMKKNTHNSMILILSLENSNH